MNELQVQRMAELEEAFRNLASGRYVRPVQLAMAMLFVHINPDAASGLVVEEERWQLEREDNSL